jgi:hypothetical protein
MPCLPDIVRTPESFAVLHASAEMNNEVARMLSSAAYAWFEREPSRDPRGALSRAIALTFSALQEDITVTEHYPEPFLVRFKFPHHCAVAVSRHDFLFEGSKVQVQPWRLEDNAEQVSMQQHVRLCIENVPLYAWNKGSTQQAIGSACSLDYIEDQCKTREYTKALCVWAWVERPALVPLVGWVTLPGPAGVPGLPERGRRGLQRRCIIHLDIVEDLTVEEAPMTGHGEWRWGYLDGDRAMRDRVERIDDRREDRRDRDRRDEDEDHDRDRRGRVPSRGWRETLRRSLSRSGRARQDGGSRGEQDRQRDHSGNRDGGRRRAADDAPALEDVPVLERVPVLEDAPVLELVPVQGAAPVVAGLAALDVSHDDAPLVEDASDVDEPVATGPRGRLQARDASPHSSRRRSRAARTPPSTLDPASSPTAVCPSSPSSKGSCPPLLLLARDGVSPARIELSPYSAASISEGARRALNFLAPSDSSASRPPGFEASLELVPASPPLLRDSVDVTTEAKSQLLQPLFYAAEQPLLSPPTRRVINCRKTLAGVRMVCNTTYSLQRTSARLRSCQKAPPVARATEAFICRGLGIVQDGEEVMELALQDLSRRFEGEVPDHVLATLRELFKVSSQEEEDVDEALLQHSGAAGLELADDGVDAVAHVSS